MCLLTLCLYIHACDYTAPSGHPLSFQVVSKSSRSIFLSWAPPQLDLQNGILRHYVITIKSDSGRETRKISAPVNSSALTGLQPHTIYELSLAAVTISSGPSTPTVSVQTSEDGNLLVIDVSK